MNDTVETTYGSCIELEFAFANEDGSPENITNNHFEIVEASSPAFSAAVFTLTDPVQGKVKFFMPAVAATKLSRGRTNWFRVQRTWATGCADNTLSIWVNVK